MASQNSERIQRLNEQYHSFCLEHKLAFLILVELSALNDNLNEIRAAITNGSDDLQTSLHTLLPGAGRGI